LITEALAPHLSRQVPHVGSGGYLLEPYYHSLGPYPLPLMAEDALAILDAAKVDTVDILGVSMGGCIAQLIALKYPSRLRSLVLCCTTHGGEGASVGSPLKEMADVRPPIYLPSSRPV